MNIFKLQKKIYIGYLISFYIFAFGKFFIISFTIMNILNDFFKNKMTKELYVSYRYAVIILFIFMTAFFSAVLQNNDILHIIRNNFYTIIFIFTGIHIGYIYRNNLNELLEDTIRVVGVLAFIQILIYIMSILSSEFHLFVIHILTKKIGYSIAFAGLGENNSGFGMKMVTNLTSIYIFLIPYVFFVNHKKLQKYIFFIILAVILSISLTQYSILLIYILIYYLKSLKYPILFIKKIFSLKFLITVSLIIYFLIQSGLVNVLEEKVSNLLNGNNSSELTSTSLRIIQAKILFSEFEESPLFGKGLGYDSKKYHKIRDLNNGNNEIKYFNYSMYENQYLDILMKFGIFGALAIYYLFFFYPMYKLYKKYKYSKNELYFSIMLGYFGLTIFAGSNGNTFYAYTTMFIWGIIIYFISSKTLLNKEGK